MLHLLKYQFLQTIRSRSIMFWALAFPLILGTLFYVSFGNTGLAGTGETDWEPVPVAIVTVESSSANAASFLTFLNETDKTVTTQEWETDGNITNHLIKGLLEYNIDTLNSVYADANFMLQRINMNTIYNNNYQTPSNPYYHSNVFDKINQHDGAREINLSYRNLYPHKKRERFLCSDNCK